MSALVNKALEIAISQIGVRELARNRGVEVDNYLTAVGLDPTKGSYPWCAAFVWFCYQQAARSLRVSNPAPKTASVMKMWAKTPFWFRRPDPSPGSVFIIDHGSGRGHTGFVEFVTPTSLVTVEGNTNDRTGSREGDGVYRLTSRKRPDIVGYIDYSLPVPAAVA